MLGMDGVYDLSCLFRPTIMQVVQKLIPQLPTIENILNILLHNCKFEKLFLFDVLSKVRTGAGIGGGHAG
jgi:hypothetical protein